MPTRKKAVFGIFSGYDPRPWVMKDCADNDLLVLDKLIADLSKIPGISLVFPGAKKKGWDKLCHSMPLCEEYAEEFSRHKLDGIINVHLTWTFPQLSQKVLSSYIRKMKATDPMFSPRIALVSIQDTTVPGMVSGMATAGALVTNGIPFTHIYGDFNSKKTIGRIRDTLGFFAKRTTVHAHAASVVNSLHSLHAIEFGSLSLQMPTTRINQEELVARWGITSENLDQQVFLDRALTMFDWEGTPGKSTILRVKDSYVRQVLETVYDKSPEKFTVVKGRTVSRDTFALQVAIYKATAAIAKEKGAGAITIKCQDECSSQFCTCCIATAYLGNDVDPLGRKKAVVPTSCETDLPTMYTQYILNRLTGLPSGFGDFRYVKTDDQGRTLLAVVNCGQHPAYYAGRQSDSTAKKLANIEYPGQEHFYAAGGSAVRMRTAGGQKITLARLGYDNGRLYMAATVMNTVDVEPARHNAYNKAWPIIEGHIPISDAVIGRKWPSNHLGFVYGDCTAALIELCDIMGIGYIVWTADGAEHYKAS